MIINNTNGNYLRIKHTLGTLDQANTYVTTSPHPEPYPTLTLREGEFDLNFNCPQELTKDNYFNEVTLYLVRYSISFSFLLNCGPKDRFKQFEIGYLIISVINAIVMAGVAMHSHIWSLKYNERRLKFNLRWFHALAVSLIITLLVFGLYFFAMNYFNEAFLSVRYVGVLISFFFVYLCVNEILFLFRPMRNPLFKMVRVCDAASITAAVVSTILGFLFESWIFYNFLAGCICVGSIKLFNFQSLK